VSNKVLVPFRHPNKVKPYLEALRHAGIDAVPSPTDSPLSLAGATGLLLTGGTDVNPGRYNEAAGPQTDNPLDDERDEIELDLINQAIEKDLPILAICRGLQLLNVYHGGTLIQHLGSFRHDPDFEDRARPAHEVEIDAGTLLARSIGESRIQVNSRHHQAVGKIGAGLRVSARDPQEAVVEALERTDKAFVMAVQWHPEDQVFTQPEQLRLFRQFATALSAL
jgi:putative glutamine amidotransferase